MYHLRRICPKSLLKSVYYALFNSHCQYGLAFWGGTYESNIKPIYIIQKHVLRIIHRKTQFEPSFPLFQLSRILPIRHLYIYKVLKIFFSRSGDPALRRMKHYNLRGISGFHIPFTRKEMIKRYLICTAPRLFSLLPDSVKISTSTNNFNVELKNWLFTMKSVEIFFR